MYRSPDDIQLLAELAGVLDATVDEAGLSSGTYLVMREIVRSETPTPVGVLADRLGADKDEVAQLCSRLAINELITVRGAGLERTPVAIALINDLESRANEAMREYVLERPHSPTIYGLVAAMQTGRFTVEDLIAFITEGDDEPDED